MPTCSHVAWNGTAHALKHDTHTNTQCTERLTTSHACLLGLQQGHGLVYKLFCFASALPMDSRGLY